MDTKLNPTHDVGAAAEVRSLIDQYADAARRRDLSWIEEHYAADIRAFDAILRLEIRGRDAYLEHWRQCLEMCPGPMIFEMHDLQVEAAGNLAVGHGLSRCGAVGPDGKEQSGWMRFTSVWIRGDDGWRVAHEHFSSPFDPQTMQILNDARP
jgi:ketosteroid isomerase-like protein